MERGYLATKLIIAATTDPEMRYATGFSVPDPFILVDTGRKKYALVSKLEYGRLKRAGKTEVLLWDSYARQERSLAGIARAFLKEKGIKSVLMAGKTPIAIVEKLRKKGVKVSIEDEGLYPEREKKSEQEVAEIRKVRHATVRAMRLCIGMIAESKANEQGELLLNGRRLTSESLKLAARKVLLEAACEAPELIVSHGKQTGLPHEQGRGPLRAGEPIILDFYPRSMRSGYWFDMTRTVCKGEPSKELAALYTAVRQAQEAALAKVKAGARTDTIHKAAAEVFAKGGYETTEEEGFLHSTGHGLGLEIHEAPSIGPKSQTRLQAGSVLTIEPGLYYKGGGVRLENTVLVTRRGYKDLTGMKRVLRV